MTSYAWATGHDVADGSLVSIVADLTPYNDNVDVVLRSQPVNRFPVRVQTMDGSISGGGFLEHTLTAVVLMRAAMDYIQDTYLSNGTVASAAVTVRLRLHDRDTWQRYNAYLEIYNPDDDGTYELGEFKNVQLRFHNLQEL
jgi:hypothetical protein